jgi:O-antigen/teichoic acid export membrane protein
MMTESESAGRRFPGEEPPHVNAAVRQGYLWNMLNFLFSQGAGIVIFVALARTLSPAIFGVFALAAILVDLFALQGRWAAMDALIQRQDFSRPALSSAFFSLTAVAIVIVAGAAAGAGGVAAAFDAPAIAGVLPALALTLLLTPPIIIMDALLMRRLQFRAQAIRSIIGTLIGGGVGIAVAFSPALEWALVAQRLAAALVTLGVLFAFTRWAPSLEFNVASAAGFLRRAGQLWGTTVLASLHVRIIEAFVGLRTGAVAVGFITVARRFETLVHGPVTSPIQGLWVPVLSTLRGDHTQSWRLFLRLSQLTALIALPTFLGLALIANELIIIVFDDRYAPAGAVLMAVAVQGVFMPAGFFANLVFAGLDRSDLSLKFSLAALAACTPVVWIASAHGAVAALLAAALVMGLAGVAATAMQIRLLQGSFLSFATALAPGYSAVLAMAAALLALKWATPIHDPLVSLITHVCVGAAVYVGWLFLFHRPELLEAWQFLSHRRTEVIAPVAASAPQA